MLSVVILNVVMLSIFILSFAVPLCAIMLSVVMVCFVMPLSALSTLLLLPKGFYKTSHKKYIGIPQILKINTKDPILKFFFYHNLHQYLL
jgi:hypothetical protein